MFFAACSISRDFAPVACRLLHSQWFEALSYDKVTAIRKSRRASVVLSMNLSMMSGVTAVSYASLRTVFRRDSVRKELQ